MSTNVLSMKNIQTKFLFDTPLLDGIIVSRPNRFIMEVLVGEKIERCHCPSTGKIGGIVFENIPCLLSKCNNYKNKRKTDYTVEAISLNNLKDKKKYWIGINQVKANRYVEYFLATNQLNKMIDCSVLKIQRECKLGNSKLDFLVGNSYLEVKSPLVKLEIKDYYKTNKSIEIEEYTKFNSTDRFLKHLTELSNSLKSHEKAFLITLFMFDAVKFDPPPSKKFNYIFKAVSTAKKSGVEMWQINMVIDKYGIELKDYYTIL